MYFGKVLIEVEDPGVIDGGVDTAVVRNGASRAGIHRPRNTRKAGALERIRQAESGRDLLAVGIGELTAVVPRHGNQSFGEERRRKRMGPVGHTAVVLLFVN